MKMKSKKVVEMVEPKKFSFETFRKIGAWETGRLRDSNISCFNGFVSVVKYKVTVERIDEPTEVYAERLQKLWDECDNQHNWTPLKNMAAKLGVTLIGDSGSKKIKK